MSIKLNRSSHRMRYSCYDCKYVNICEYFHAMTKHGGYEEYITQADTCEEFEMDFVCSDTYAEEVIKQRREEWMDAYFDLYLHEFYEKYLY